MAYWLIKTEPEDFSWEQQVKLGSKGGAWTGVRNHAAKLHMQKMQNSDRAFFYHTGDEKQIMGIVEITREAYPDPTDETEKFVCVDVKAIEPLPKPVTLAAIKADKRFAEMLLVRQGRLSAQPVMENDWKAICKMGGVKG